MFDIVLYAEVEELKCTENVFIFKLVYAEPQFLAAVLGL